MWKEKLGQANALNPSWSVIDQNGVPTDTCASSCHYFSAVINHIRWPDGIADKSGRDHEPEMLEYLRAYSLE